MLRMHIGPDGLARTTFALTQLNVGATLLYHLGRSPDTIAPYWRARTADALGGGRLDLLAAITMRANTRSAPDFIAPHPAEYEAGLEAELHEVATASATRVGYEMTQLLRGNCVYAHGYSRPSPVLLEALDRGERDFAETVAGQLQLFWEAALAPDWPRIRHGLEADIGYRSTRIARCGYAEMLNTIDPGVTWRAGALHLARYNSLDVTADAIVFTPTPFGSHTVLCLDAPDAPLRRPPFISYPSMSAGGRLPRATAGESSRPVVLLRTIQAFIDQNLANPELGPATIAAAHHISERYLYLIFAGQRTSVAGWIRDRRLQGCRQDLADPALRDRPVAAIAIRWGFTTPAHFSRVFRRAFGIPPGQFRLLAHRETTEQDSAEQDSAQQDLVLREPSTALRPALMTAAADA
jgi:AraC-like DNA-binding protein